METEKDTLNALLGYLEQHGYPKDSLALEYKAGNFRVDLAVIDPKTDILIQIFEIKNKKDEQAINDARLRLKSILTALKSSGIPAYLVFPKDTPPFFEVFALLLREELISQALVEKILPGIIISFSAALRSRASQNRLEESLWSGRPGRKR
jgi:molybdopterin-guanine dinucleotide biosynthesis protein A